MAKALVKNIGYLALSQGANFILPLITIPYVTRVVGPDNYGLIEFATVVMLYFSAIVIFGFNTTATRKIASQPDNISNVSQIFSAVVSARIVLFLIALAVFTICMVWVPSFKAESKMLAFAFPIVLGWMLYPDFLFQGVQKLQFVAISNFLVKAIAAALIFIIINEPEDFYLVLAINAVAQILVGITLLVSSTRLLPGLTFAFVGWVNVMHEIKESSYVFFSLFFSRIYVFGSILFLGFMLPDYELGLFAAGAKLITVAQSFLFLPLFGALFPFLSNLYANHYDHYRLQHKRALSISLVITTVAVSALMVAPELIIQIVFGKNYIEAAPLMRVMAPLLVATVFSHFAMQQGLVVHHKDRVYLLIIVATGLLSLPLNYFCISRFGLAGAAWAKLLVEVVLALVSWLVFMRVKKEASSAK